MARMVMALGEMYLLVIGGCGGVGSSGEGCWRGVSDGGDSSDRGNS